MHGTSVDAWDISQCMGHHTGIELSGTEVPLACSHPVFIKHYSGLAHHSPGNVAQVEGPALVQCCVADHVAAPQTEVQGVGVTSRRGQLGCGKSKDQDIIIGQVGRRAPIN